jgi:hypothetical protein
VHEGLFLTNSEFSNQKLHMTTNTKLKLLLISLGAAFTLSANAAEANPEAQEPAAKASPPPLPFHTIEGYGGGAITPIAYLVNPAEDAGEVFGKPSIAYSYVHAGEKDLNAFTFTETLWGRVELGYGYDKFGVGTLDDDILAATGVDLDRSSVGLHNFNLRALVLKEDAYLPAVTVGFSYKKNDGIGSIDDQLGGALSSIGLDDNTGYDFTVTASKSFSVGGRPLIVSAGLRNSEASHIGLLGFSDDRHTTFEGNLVYVPTNWLVLGYEYRQKADPYGRINGLVGQEDDWQALDASWIINEHATFVVGWAKLGTLANTKEDSAWFIQVKYEL